MSVKCPEHNRSWRYAYEGLGCRCAVCTVQNAAKSESQRRRRGDRVQLRRTAEAVFCPLRGKTTATAYREGCRCPVCKGEPQAPVDALGQYPDGTTGVRCPSTGRTVREAYGKGCRCTTCTTATKVDNIREAEAKAERRVIAKNGGDSTSALCPETGMGPAVAFRDGCRCTMCTQRERPIPVNAATLEKLEALWAKADAAFRLDDAYVVDMAEESLKVAIKRGVEEDHNQIAN